MAGRTADPLHRGHWHLGRIGDGSLDELAGPITNMFDFSARHARELFLDRETGLPADRGERGERDD